MLLNEEAFCRSCATGAGSIDILRFGRWVSRVELYDEDCDGPPSDGILDVSSTAEYSGGIGTTRTGLDEPVDPSEASSAPLAASFSRRSRSLRGAWLLFITAFLGSGSLDGDVGLD